MTISLGHISVALDDMVTVIFTSHEIYGRTKNILEEMMLYNV